MLRRSMTGGKHAAVALRRAAASSIADPRAPSGADSDKRPRSDVDGPSSHRSFAGMYPDFLPTRQWDRRNALSEKIERREMLRRRTRIAIPEFYVGSILSVTCSDKYAPGRSTRFVGIVIDRGATGLRSNVLLRNCVDGMGVEVLYDLYNPTVKAVQVLRLRRHRDPHMIYVRDALHQYYTIDPDMEPEPTQPGAPIQTSDMKVILKNPPWCQRWEMYDLHGLDKEDVWNKTTGWYKRRYITTPTYPHLKYDLMLDYRMHIAMEEQRAIMAEMAAYERRADVADSLQRDRRRWLYAKADPPKRRMAAFVQQQQQHADAGAH